MSLSSRHLRHILTLARVLNFSRAAAEIGITQSALSKSVQAFETEFGIRLFDRDRSGVKLAASARSILERAHSLLAEVNAFENHIDRVARSEEGEIKFGIAPFPAYLLLAKSLGQLLCESPDIRFRAVTRSSTVMSEMMLAGEIDFCIATEDAIPLEAAIRMEMLGRVPIGLFARSGHPLLASKEGGDRYSILQASPAVMPSNILEKINGFASGDIQIVEDYSSLLTLALNSDGILMSSALAIPDELSAGQLVEIFPPDRNPIPPIAICYFNIVRRTHSPLARRLKQIFQAQLTQISRSHSYERKQSYFFDV